MLVFVVLLACTGGVASSILSRQLPACGTQCITTLSTNVASCSSADLSCLCQNPAFVTATAECFRQSCSAGDADSSYAAAVALCGSVGVNIATVTAATPTSTSAASVTTFLGTTRGSVTSLLATTRSLGSSSPLTTNPKSVSSAGPSSTAGTSNTPTSSHKGSTGAIVGGVVGGVVGVVLLCILAYLCRRRVMRNRQTPPRDVLEQGPHNAALEAATAEGKADVPYDDYRQPTSPTPGKSAPMQNSELSRRPLPELPAESSGVAGGNSTSSGTSALPVASRLVPAIRSEIEKVNRGDSAVPNSQSTPSYSQDTTSMTSVGGSSRQEVPLGQEEMIHRIAATVAAMLRDDPQSGVHSPPPDYNAGQARRL